MNKPTTRNAEATQKRILAAAKREFAEKGLAGARVDEISAQADANKRMIYHYFGSKDELFTAVLENSYADIRSAEQNLDLANLAPEKALEKLVRFTWEYYLANPEFLTLVNSENLHQARHLKSSASIGTINSKFVETVAGILDRGVQNGVFRSGVSPEQLNITIAAVGYYYLTNRHTLSVIFGFDFMSHDALQQRIEFNIETILRLVRA